MEEFLLDYLFGRYFHTRKYGSICLVLLITFLRL